MGFFSKKFESYLGVDIGGGGIKIVEVRNDKHRARLSTYGFADDEAMFREAGANSSTNIGDPERASATLRDICTRAKVETTQAVTGLPIAAVFSSIITLPRMPKKELPNAVAWEAKKLVPLPLEDVIMDWKLLTPEAELEKKAEEGKSATVRVLLTAAPKTLVEQYLGVFQRAGLELVSLETEAFALIRALVGADPAPVCILDIGATRTSMVIIDDATPVFNRSIEVGGKHFTKAIADAMGADPESAERLKLDLAVLPSGNAAVAALPAILPVTLAPVIQEVRYGLNLYLSQEEHRGRVIEKIILAGGSALLPTLPGLLARELNLRVFVGDPWARVIYPVDLRPALDAIGSRFAVAVGLAMREVA